MSNLLSGGFNLIVFVGILGVLVFVHEFGHFIVAKRLGIPVLEFGFGFPPRIKRFMKIAETEYTLNAIPVGGFVRLMGEEDPNVPGGFMSAKPW
ncbi:MAG TPA: site-2 protease family protein, partial [Anaerolineae bacterium]